MLAALAPITATMRQTAAHHHSPSQTKPSAAVPATPSNVQPTNCRLRPPARSAMAPSIGARIASNRPAMPLAKPSREVLTVGSTPTLQNFWKKTGKNPASTVVKNAEFAQS